MNKLKSIFAITLAIPMMLTNVMALDSNLTSKTTKQAMGEIIKKNSGLEIYDELVAPQSLSLNGKEIPLYVTFKDQTKALKNFIEKFKEELDFIKKEFKLSDLNENNYENYFSAITVATDSNLLPYEIGNEMQEYFDIFENKDKNLNINNMVITAMKRDISSNDKLEEINYFTPTYTDEESQKSRINVGMPNLTAAVNYAKKYAVSQNPLYRYFKDADCTNFVSQILNNGGVKQETYSSRTSGWWYKSSSSYSYSWTVADTFRKYMGYSTKYYSWNSLKNNLVKGSFIGKDTGGDGDVNHMAFITDKKADGSQVQIAQHSTNYLKWSNDTGWINIGNAIYYIVR